MVQVKYWDPADDSIVTGQLASEQDLPCLLDTVSNLTGTRGHPAVELIRPDGSSLSIATDGPRCFLVWIDSLEASFHSVGGAEGPVLFFDYFGSWSEAPAEFTVAMAEALECARRFVRSGAPDSESVLFEPD